MYDVKYVNPLSAKHDDGVFMDVGKNAIGKNAIGKIAIGKNAIGENAIW